MGNFFSNQSESLLDVKSNFMQSPTISGFKKIEDSLDWCQKKQLGYLYKVWKTACLYTFMMEKRTNLTSDDLICDFRDLEHQTIEGFKDAQEWALYPMIVLWKVTDKAKYEKIIKNVNDPYYRSLVDGILTEIMM